MAKSKGKKRRRRVRKKRAWSRGAKQRVSRLYRIRKRRAGQGQGFLRGAINKIWSLFSPGYSKEVRKMQARLRRYRVRARGKTASGRRKQGARDKANLTDGQKEKLREAKKFFQTGVSSLFETNLDVKNYGGKGGGALVVAAKRRGRRRVKRRGRRRASRRTRRRTRRRASRRTRRRASRRTRRTRRRTRRRRRR